MLKKTQGDKLFTQAANWKPWNSKSEGNTHRILLLNIHDYDNAGGFRDLWFQCWWKATWSAHKPIITELQRSWASHLQQTEAHYSFKDLCNLKDRTSKAENMAVLVLFIYYCCRCKQSKILWNYVSKKLLLCFCRSWSCLTFPWTWRKVVILTIKCYKSVSISLPWSSLSVFTWSHLPQNIKRHINWGLMQHIARGHRNTHFVPAAAQPVWS